MWSLPVHKLFKCFKWISKCLVVVFIIFSVGILMIANGFVRGLTVQVVTSNSMEPQIKTGSLIISKEDSKDCYGVGDIVTYYSPSKDRKLITHRVVKTFNKPDGVRIVYTKGDANTNGDPWSVNVGLIVGRVVWVTPYLGYWLYFIKTFYGFLVFVLITFLFLIVPNIKHVWLSLREDIKA